MGFFAAPAPMELIVILGIALLVLGPKKLPEAARSVGRGVREFRESLSEMSIRDEEDPDELVDAEDEEEEDEEETAEEPAARSDV